MDSKLSSLTEAWSPPIAGFIQNDSQFHLIRLLSNKVIVIDTPYYPFDGLRLGTVTAKFIAETSIVGCQGFGRELSRTVLFRDCSLIYLAANPPNSCGAWFLGK